jgi:hypothetical protein
MVSQVAEKTRNLRTKQETAARVPLTISSSLQQYFRARIFDPCLLASASTTKQQRRTSMAIFDETYRVVAVESQRLTIQGVASGEIMTIVNAAPETPLTSEDYPLGQLVALTDPASELPN